MSTVLVDDIWISILLSLSIPEVLTLRKTCRRLNALTHIRLLWYLFFTQKRIPAPGPTPIAADSCSCELELRLRRALFLEKTWGTSQLVLQRVQTQKISDDVKQFIMLAGGTKLLLLTSSSIRLWSLPECVILAEHTLPPTRAAYHSVLDAAVDPANSVINIACGSLTPVSSPLQILCINTHDDTITPLTTFSSLAGRLMALHGSWVYMDTSEAIPTSHTADQGVIEGTLWSNYDDTTIVVFPRYAHIFNNQHLLGITFFASHVLFVWDTCILVFPLPFNANTIAKVHVQQPIQVYPLARSITSASVVTSTCSTELADTTTALSIISADAHIVLFPSPDTSDVVFPYRLTRLSSPDARFCVGPSGRGISLDADDEGGMKISVPRAVCIPSASGGVVVVVPVSVNIDARECSGGGNVAAFDEGMGRVVRVSQGAGVVDVMDFL